MGKDEIIERLRGRNFAEISGAEVSQLCDEISKVTGAKKPQQIQMKRLMVENFYNDFKDKGGQESSAPAAGGKPRGGGSLGFGSAPAAPPSGSGLNEAALNTADDIVAAIAKAQGAPLAANDVTVLAAAIAKVEGKRAP
eukprot:CAMPEP_0206012792 /NCGR_PEP_ID=MMETSP1464-20131121/15436_1 /ASSEMBLY_ACC=CAM_ASM_001124 /TAXON_ID=119497 /ORGANISM="Exanthemachrysis gayraliae, Strain RCC1523" /LENGTH=138 /DNA_ID=CAMNT_0053386493 /DNA_START=62 /DNA_END=475 /DNA_ORIENTATION=+